MSDLSDSKFHVLSKAESSIDVDGGRMFSFFPHYHVYYELTLYEPFSGYISINDMDIDINTMTAILVAPSDFHRGTVNGGTKATYNKIAFNEEILLPDCIPSTSVVLDNIRSDDFIASVFGEIRKNQDDETYKKTLVNAAVYNVCRNGKAISTIKKDRIGLKAARIVNENFDEELTLSIVASRLYVTPQYLSAAFKSDIGMNFSEYLSTVRLRRAKKILTETNESITSVCEMCGYGNFSHFLRSFKKKYGVSPTFYRKNAEKNRERT